MRIVNPRADFVIVEDFFSAQAAQEWIELILTMGNDPVRGFQHPFVKPNRFHQNPKYPVKKFMCFGYYWNPKDYQYHSRVPGTEISPFPIPQQITDLARELLKEFYQWDHFSPQSVLVNFYTEKSSMGLHVDKDEEDRVSPVIGLNFGSTCRFFYENEVGEMRDLKIPGNSIYIFGRSARLMRHGIGSIYANSLAPGSEYQLTSKERLNLTIRQIFKSSDAD